MKCEVSYEARRVAGTAKCKRSSRIDHNASTLRPHQQERRGSLTQEGAQYANAVDAMHAIHVMVT